MHDVQSPRTDDAGIELEIQRVGADKAPRVTPQDILDNIASAHYFTAGDAVTTPSGAVPEAYEQLRLLTFCVIVTKSGFTVTGESACASPENFDALLGKRIAFENAKQKLWPLMGYALKERLLQAQQPQAPEPHSDLPLHQQRAHVEKAELDERFEKLSEFIDRSDTFATLDAAEQERLHRQRSAMSTYRAVLAERIGAFGVEGAEQVGG